MEYVGGSAATYQNKISNSNITMSLTKPSLVCQGKHFALRKMHVEVKAYE